jgi:hypothetical protein
MKSRYVFPAIYATAASLHELSTHFHVTGDVHKSSNISDLYSEGDQYESLQRKAYSDIFHDFYQSLKVNSGMIPKIRKHNRSLNTYIHIYIHIYYVHTYIDTYCDGFAQGIAQQWSRGTPAGDVRQQ